ncbi:MAG TPA: hypothetical protein VHE35_14675 [Kofleriaceae bacterium]|nr:hypothetical protein [Kofleriaceae bacterium]
MEFSVGNALGTSIKVWLRNFAPFTLLSVLIHAPLWIWLASILSGDPTQGKVDDLRHYSQFGTVIGMLLNMFVTSTVTYGVVMELRGSRASMGKSISVGLARFLPALGVTLLSIIAATFGLVLLIVPGVILYCMYYVSVPASVIERPGVIGALKRSAVLTRGDRGGIFGMLLVFFFALFMVGIVIAIMTGVRDPQHQTWDGLRHQAMLNVALEALTSTFLAVLAAVTYVQLRFSKDGASADELAKVFD